MEKSPKCIYCGAKLYKGSHLCNGCQAKLKLVRRILAIGTEIKLQAARERLTV